MSDIWYEMFPNDYIFFKDEYGILYNGDVINVLNKFPDESIDCVITSPPYWGMRNYQIEGQIGLEDDFEKYIEKLWEVFDEVYRILKPSGTVWVNLGDTYGQNWRGGGVSSSSKKQLSNRGTVDFMKRKAPKRVKVPQKSLFMIPERFAIGMIDRGWILRNQIIWQKINVMPTSIRDRFTVDFEKIFFFVKEKKYYFNQLKEPTKDGKKTRNKRTIWPISVKPFKGAHFAVFPPEIPEICIKAGCPEGGIVLDPFIGSGTTAVVAERLGRRWIGIDLNTDYCDMASKRILDERQLL